LLEVETDFISGRFPPDLVQSVFVNEDIYLVVANHGSTALSAPLNCDAVDCENPQGEIVSAGREVTIAPSDLRVWRLAPRVFQEKPTSRNAASSSTPVSHEEV
jgi:hypothetical protein